MPMQALRVRIRQDCSVYHAQHSLKKRHVQTTQYTAKQQCVFCGLGEAFTKASAHSTQNTFLNRIYNCIALVRTEAQCLCIIRRFWVRCGHVSLCLFGDCFLNFRRRFGLIINHFSRSVSVFFPDQLEQVCCVVYFFCLARCQFTIKLSCHKKQKVYAVFGLNFCLCYFAEIEHARRYKITLCTRQSFWSLSVKILWERFVTQAEVVNWTKCWGYLHWLGVPVE